MENELKLEDLLGNNPENGVSASDTNDSTLQTIEDSEQQITPQGEDAPLERELERLKPKRTQEEKLEYNINRMQRELNRIRGIDDNIKSNSYNDTEEDDRPLTVGEFRKLQAQQAAKSAIELAEAIPNSAERELTKFHIENTIRPSGDANEDLARARALANSVRNQQIADMHAKRVPPSNHSGSTGVPANQPKEQLNLTKEELELKQLAGLSDEEILDARRRFKPEMN